MAKFFLGQRVRKARGTDAGNTGRVVGFISRWERVKRFDFEFNIEIRFDHAGHVIPEAIASLVKCAIAIPMILSPSSTNTSPQTPSSPNC